MSYQVIARKWRPKTFEDVVGQDHVVKTMRNAIEQNRLAQAYLLCGPRGTGKTTCAKILAKVVNCLNPIDGNPCNECENCRAIDNGTATDVIEMDAATNTGVDYIRELRDSVVYTPAMLKNIYGMAKGFTVKRACSMLGGALSKEQILEINAKLNKVKAPKK